MKEASKKTWVLIVFLIAFVGLGIFLLWSANSSEPQVNSESESDNLTPETVSSEEQSQTNIGAKREKMNECEAIKDVEKKQNCMDEVIYLSIQNEENRHECHEIQNTTLKQLCSDKTYIQSATSLKDESICQKIQDQNLEIQCLKKVEENLISKATSAEDCQKIESVMSRQTCLDKQGVKAAKTLEECDQIVDSNLKLNCSKRIQNIQTLQSNKNAESPCKTLNPEQKTRCQNTLKMQLALQEKNPENCLAISTSELSKECLDMLETKQDNYFLRMAVATNSAEQCAAIQDLKIAKRCQEMLP